MLSRTRRRSICSAGAAFEPLEQRVALDATLPLVTLSVTDSFSAERDSDQGRFVITRFGNTDSPLRVNFQILGTATPGEDYLALRGFATIPAGRRSVNIPVVPIDDLADEPNETVRLLILQDGAYRRDEINPANRTLSITIQDDDNVPTVTLATPDDRAGEVGNDEATFAIRRTGPIDLPLTVTFRIGGSATPDTDYQALPVSVTIPVGRRASFLTVRALNDAAFEGDETVRLTLLESEQGLYQLKFDEPGRIRRVVTIADRPLVTLRVTDPLATSEPDDVAEFTVSRTGLTDAALRVSYMLEGSAVAGTDYDRPPPVITIPAGQSSVRVIIRGLSADLSQPFKTIRLTLRPLQTYNLNFADAGTISAFVTIIDDTVPPGV
ncbi:MAG: hypothetical protein K2W85_11015 [Phycisphaerales bacterium]|nr:hypothetical protein [Phycisphaerales bacterium]